MPAHSASADEWSNPEQMAGVTDSVRRALIECIASATGVERTTGRIALLLPEDDAMAALKACIREYARLERASGALPEQVVVRLKEMVLSSEPPFDHIAQLRDWAVRWCIAAYFDE